MFDNCPAFLLFPRSLFHGRYGAALRGLYIIDGTGTVRSVLVNDDSVGRSVDEVLRVVSAFQHTDKHGVVCPANWQPGGNTIVPDQKSKMTFFETEYGAKSKK
jgi:alkyl hydroperoxide reductase subunit AhpC